jgi:hypothetical protein
MALAHQRRHFCADCDFDPFGTTWHPCVRSCWCPVASCNAFRSASCGHAPRGPILCADVSRVRRHVCHVFSTAFLPYDNHDKPLGCVSHWSVMFCVFSVVDCPCISRVASAHLLFPVFLLNSLWRRIFSHKHCCSVLAIECSQHLKTVNIMASFTKFALYALLSVSSASDALMTNPFKVKTGVSM